MKKQTIIILTIITILTTGCTKTNYLIQQTPTPQTYTDSVTPMINAKTGTSSPTWDETYKTYYLQNPISSVTQDTIFVQFQLPHTYKQGSSIHCHIHGFTDTTSTNNITLEMNYTWYNINELVTTSYIITKNFTPSGTAYNETIFNFGEINKTNAMISSTFKTKITRINGDPNNDRMYIDFFDCHYLQDSLGSRQEYIK